MRNKMRKNIFISICFFLMLLCSNFYAAATVNIQCPPNLTIQKLPEHLPSSVFNIFSYYMRVFGVSIYATNGVKKEKLLHAANVLAQYLDNDASGCPDNMNVIGAMLKRHSTLVIFKNPNTIKAKKFFNATLPDKLHVQDLYDEEIRLKNGADGHFDESLEEILHLITDNGYAQYYPDVFATHSHSQIANAMDKARGGHFIHIPAKYPKDAWYTYHDKTCNYACQITEYTYWALTSFLGGQSFPGRYDQIKDEWRLNTREKLFNRDILVSRIITDPIYKLPTILPDGHYKGS